MDKYSYGQWEKDNEFSPQLFQEVDEDVVEELANNIPPINYSSTLIIIGEAYSHVEHKGKWVPTYTTFVSIDGWIFLGHIPNDKELRTDLINEYKNKLEVL